jgi:hypothetical protein
VRTHAVIDRVIDFEIRTSQGRDYLVRLYDFATDRLIRSVFVEGGRTQHVKVPLGRFRLRYGSGIEWFDYYEFFGEDTIYKKMETILNFEHGYQYWVQLYVSRDGNVRSTPISKPEF